MPIKVNCAHDKMVPFADLLPNPRNPNKHPKRQIKLLAKIIKRQGWRHPITVSNKSGFIVHGHGRYEAARLLRAKKVPVDYQDYVNDAQEWEDLIADNKIAELAEMDDELTANLLKELNDINIDLTFTCLSSEEVNILLNKQGLTNEDAIPEDVHAKTKSGDLFRLGDHKLLCGDAKKREDVTRLMGGRDADMVFIDPPYGMNYSGTKKKRKRIVNDNLKDKEFYDFLFRSFQNAFEHTVCGGGVYVCCSDSQLHNVRRALGDAGYLLKQTLVWVKSGLVLGRRDYHYIHEPILYGWAPGKKHNWYGARKKTSVAEMGPGVMISQVDGGKYEIAFSLNDENVVICVSDYQIVTCDNFSISIWRVPKPAVSKEHPTMKPVALVEIPIRNSSKPGDIVSDLFGGAGSTLIACERTERVCRMMEIEPHYCDVIIKRWEDFTGQKAKRIK